MEDPAPLDISEEGRDILVSIMDHWCTSLTMQEGPQQSVGDDSKSGQAVLMEEPMLLDTDRDISTTQEEGGEQSAVVKDSGVSIVTEQAGEPEELTTVGDSLRKSMRAYIDGTLPDLLRNGSPLRRHVSTPVSDTLKQVRREVELSRRRSLRLKAQVDKLQERSVDGPGWSQHRDRVTEEIQSIVKLLLPLTDLESSPVETPLQENFLDTTLLQLQNVARRLAVSHTSQAKVKGGNGGDDGAVLQQALRDRDEAVAKKKAMEAELLRSKTEMMLLNNQLLEAVQRRLELSLELEAWKDDVQIILHQQLLAQQQAEQKKTKGLGFLRRPNKPAPKTPSPSLARAPAPTSSPAPTPSHSPANTPVAQRWRERLRLGRPANRQGDNSNQLAQDGGQVWQPPGGSREDRFHTVSLD